MPRKFLSLYSLVALLGLAHALPADSVELTANKCQTAPHFREGDVKLSTAQLIGFKPVSAFPVLLNAAHKPTRNGALIDYSLVCTFEMPATFKGERFLYLPGIGENFDIFLNGEKIHADIHVKDGRIETYRYAKFLNVPMAANQLKPGENTLFFHIAGYAPVTPLSENFLLGLPFRSGYVISAIRGEGPGSLLLFFLTASYIFFAFYHLFFYLRWREKSYNLHFAVFSLAISGYFLAFSQEAFARVENTRYLIMASYVCQMVALAFFLLYVQRFFFENRRMPRYIAAAVAVDLLLAAAIGAGRDTWYQSLLTFWYLTAIPQVVIIFWLIGNAVRLKLPDARLLAASIAVALLMIAFDMLDTLLIYSNVRLSQFAYFTVVVSLVLIMANRFINIHHETDRLNRQLSLERNSFSRFVPSQFLENLGRTTAVEIRRGDAAQRQMGILFLDIRNFTGMAEKLTPTESLVFLNVFMKKMEQCISQNGGFVDKYIGDGLLALFGSQDDEVGEGALQAVRAGRQMLASLDFFSRYNAQVGETKIGIGVHCGPLVMGTLGSKRRLDTTVIGDAVNLASRLEMLTTLYGVPMLVSDAVYEKLPGSESIDMRRIDTVRVKGRKQAVTIYEDFHHDPEAIVTKKKQAAVTYTQALDLYKQANFSEAAKLFDFINNGSPYDMPAAALSQRCAKLARNGAPPNWDGVLPLGKK
jgi:adenylate cyclase